mgnify:FL=1
MHCYWKTARVRRLLAGSGMLLLLCPPSGLADHPMFEMLLESADPSSLSEWGRRFENGVSVPQNIDRAIQVYCKAALAGDASAQNGLGKLYASGRAGKRNEVLAVAWFKLAARQGDREARNMLRTLGGGARRLNREPPCPLSDELTTEIIAESTEGLRTNLRAGDTRTRRRVETLVRKLAPQYGLDPRLVLAVVEVESSFNPKALSPKNAQGLMQLIPKTAARFGVKDVWNPEQNLRGGMAYLRWLLEHFGGDLRLSLAAYNAGEQAVRRYGGIPPYRETRNYVRRISERVNVKEIERGLLHRKPSSHLGRRQGASATGGRTPGEESRG